MEEVEEILRSGTHTHVAAEGMGDEVEGQQPKGLQNSKRLNEVIDVLGGQPEGINEVNNELKGEPRHSNIVIKEAGGQLQTLMEIKRLSDHIGPFDCEWA